MRLRLFCVYGFFAFTEWELNRALVPFEAPGTRCLGLTVTVHYRALTWLQGSSKCAHLLFSPLVYGQHLEERIDSEDYTGSRKKPRKFDAMDHQFPTAR